MIKRSTIRNPKKGTLIFVSVWAAVICVILLLWGVFLIYVEKLLVEYESVQPQYAAEDVFQKYFLEADYKTILSYDEYEYSNYETEESLHSYFEKYLQGKKLTYTSSVSSNQSIKAYIVAADGVQLATFTLGESDEKTELLGLPNWELKDINVALSPYCGVNVYAPLNAIVSVNGKPLTADYIVGDKVTLEDAVYFPEDDEDFRIMVNYYIEGFFEAPTVSVSAPGANGFLYDLEFDEKNAAYSAEYAYLVYLADKHNNTVLKNEEHMKEAEERRRLEEERKKQEEEEQKRKEEEERQQISDSIEAIYGDFIVEAMKAYSKYTYMANSTHEEMLPKVRVYYKYGSTIYNFLNNYYNYYSYLPMSYDYQNIDPRDFAWLNDKQTQFSCRFTMTLVMEGYTPTAQGNIRDTISVDYDLVISVDISGSTPKIFDQVLYTE